MYNKLLDDLEINEEVLAQETPSRVLRKLLKAYMNSPINSEDLKNFILNYARKNDLVFLCPKEWLTSVELNKAEEVDHKKFLFTIKTEGLTAEFIRVLIQALKDVKSSDSDLVVSLSSSGEDLPEKIVLSEKSRDDLFDTEENYLSEDIIEESEELEEKSDENKKADKEQKETEVKEKSENMEKASELEELNIQVIAQDSALENIFNAINNSQMIVLDPDVLAKQFNTENIFVDSFVISEPDNRGIKTVRVEGSNLSDLAEILTSIGETGNEGYSFPVLVDGEYLLDWEGDIADYVVDVDLNKATSTPFNIQLESRGLNREQAELQETLANLGVLLEVVYVKGRQIYNVYVDIDSDSSKIIDVFEYNGLSLISSYSTIFYKVLSFSHLENKDFIKENLLVEISSLYKATKGTPGYDEWISKFQQKRKSNKPVSKKEVRDFLELPSIEERLKQVSFAIRRAEAEEELERMFRRR